MIEVTYYIAGSFPGRDEDDFEVMLESTADLMAAAPLSTRVAVVERDAAAMADGLTHAERIGFTPINEGFASA
jgi:hypothetical protein